MTRMGLAALTLIAGSGAAHVTASVPLDVGAMDRMQWEIGSCGAEESFSVQYVSAGADSPAILPIDAVDLTTVNTVSASGARYASDALQ